MKKTEKIEIRVSHTEKDMLTQLAQTEDRSVSEMLRDLARKYVLLNQGQSRPRFFKPKLLLALSLCFVIGGVIFTYVPRMMIATPYYVSGHVGDKLFGSTISKFGYSEIETSEYVVAVQYSRKRRNHPTMKIEIFQNQPVMDAPVTTAEFTVDNETPRVWRNDAALGDSFYLIIINEDMERSEIDEALKDIWT